LYIPEKKVVVGRERIGTFGSEVSFITDTSRIIEEAEDVMHGAREFPEIGMTVSDVREKDISNSELVDAISHLRAREAMDTLLTGYIS
jgi:hypothetical protein